MPHRWTKWAQKLQALAQNGLTYCENDFDRERYRQILDIASEIIAEHTNHTPQHIMDYFTKEDGYMTPKVDVRGVIMQDGKTLLVREAVDGKWTLPGGWADPWATPMENVEREIFEESGYEVKAKRLLAVYDREKQGHRPKLPYRVYKLFFHCEITGGKAEVSMETTGVGFFSLDNLPDLSLARTTPTQLYRMNELINQPEALTDFD